MRQKRLSDQELKSYLARAAAGDREIVDYLESLIDDRPALLPHLATLANGLRVTKSSRESQAAEFFALLERTAAQTMRDALLAGRTDPLAIVIAEELVSARTGLQEADRLLSEPSRDVDVRPLLARQKLASARFDTALARALDLKLGIAEDVSGDESAQVGVPTLVGGHPSVGPESVAPASMPLRAFASDTA